MFHYILKGSLIESYKLFQLLSMASTLTNIAEHDEMPKFAASYPGLYRIAEVQFIVTCQKCSNRSARIGSFSICSEYIDRCM